MKLRIAIFLVLSILLITFAFYGFQICYSPNVLVDKQPRELIIEKGTTYTEFLQRMDKEGYVNDLVSFSFIARLYNIDEHMFPGRYVLRPNMTNLNLVQMLRAGLQSPVGITFSHARLLPELAGRITERLAMTPAAFDSAVTRFAHNNTHGFTTENILALFLPNTYEVYYTINPDKLVERMLEEYQKFWNDARRGKAEAIGLTPIEVSVLASIVQAETVKQEEATRIAGLYINRLKKDMLLQADPTVVFAVGDFTLKRVLNTHKAVDSPYNTYKHVGLPPGPINMPRIGTINAVLSYEPHNYYYMCAREDFSGFHNFTRTYSAHLKNATKYQRALTIEQRKGRKMKR